MPVLFLIRGLPGSGKTTLARSLKDIRVYEADDYFTEDGEYRFDSSKLHLAHDNCYQRALAAIARRANVAVSNTFSRYWEMEKYLLAAKQSSYTVVVIDLYDAGLTDEQLFSHTTHQVPLERISEMRARWERVRG